MNIDVSVRKNYGKFQLDVAFALAEKRWGKTDLILTESGAAVDNVFELAAKDITLFKRHPEASSARNLLPCRVTGIFGAGNRIGVELDCSGGRLICQIVPESVRELDIRQGAEVIAP